MCSRGVLNAIDDPDDDPPPMSPMPTSLPVIVGSPLKIRIDHPNFLMDPHTGSRHVDKDQDTNKTQIQMDLAGTQKHTEDVTISMSK